MVLGAWFYLILKLIPIVILIIFFLSAIYTKEEKGARYPSVLNFENCSIGSLISMIIILILMFLTVIALVLLAYNDLYDNSEVCTPILYYFGNKDNCKKSITRTANIETRLYNIKTILQEIEANKIQRAHSGTLAESFQTKTESKSLRWYFSQFTDKFYEYYYRLLKMIFSFCLTIYHDFWQGSKI